MRVGVLDLILPGQPRRFGHLLYARYFSRQYASIMAQVVSAWCRQLGHETYYATYWGQAAPESLVPQDVDVLFVSCYTWNSPLAYALSRIFRAKGAVTVLGGPHAKGFPADCLRFFDIVVKSCNREVIKDIVDGHYPPQSIVSTPKPLTDFPSVEERMPEIATASFHEGRPLATSVASILASVGCPYDCDFCTDWNNPYSVLPAERLKADLHFLSRNYPKLIIAYHDPNFGVRFDETMDVIESVPEGRRNPYIAESSLSVLKESRIPRLRATNCAFIMPGIESWADYSNKAAVGRKEGVEKFEAVVAHLDMIAPHVQGIQANIIFGTDADAGTLPVELTSRFIREMPGVWPGLGIPIPFGGTPLTDRWMTENRVLRAIPFAFYRSPYVTFRLAHYDLVEFYDHWLAMRRLMISSGMLYARLSCRARPIPKMMYILRSLALRVGYHEAKEHRDLLASDREFRAFHEMESAELPAYYRHKFDQLLGPYAALLSDEDRTPRLEQPAVPVRVVAGPKARSRAAANAAG